MLCPTCHNPLIRCCRATQPRFVIREHGPLFFSVYDTVTRRDYDVCFTRRAAQRAADRRNRNAEAVR